MKFNKYIIKPTSLMLFVALLFSNCESFELDNTDPNNLAVNQSDPDFILNEVQLDFATATWQGINNPSRDIIRMENLFQGYGSVVSPTTLDAGGGEWAQIYRSQENIKLLREIGASQEIPYHFGIAQVIQCFNWVMLVDIVGDIPFSQANNFLEFPVPDLDSGQDVYNSVLGLLDEAIDSLSTTSVILPTNDLFYDSDVSKWIALANTLKLKMYLNTSLIDETGSIAAINDLIANADLIDDPSEDFQFQFTTTGPPVESRHPFFTGNYLVDANTYMSNYLVYLMLQSKTTPDPRLNYYIYRQTDEDPTGQNLPCDDQPAYEFCYLGNGYWARDHADGEGLPGDGLQRSTYGVYPGGGAYDAGTFATAAQSDNADGAGIHPILLSSFTNFMLAEASLQLGTTGDPLTYMTNGVRQSFNKVSGFLNSPTIPTADINSYVAFVSNEYNGAVSDTERLFVISREYWLAAFGNGIEMYNMYRRTGMPINDPSSPNYDPLADLQEPVFITGPFPRSFPYPQDAVNNNANIRNAQNAFTDRVFWDNNPPGFIN